MECGVAQERSPKTSAYLSLITTRLSCITGDYRGSEH